MSVKHVAYVQAFVLIYVSMYMLHHFYMVLGGLIVFYRGAELFQATIVKAVKARIEEEKKSMDQLKRQYGYLPSFP